MEFNKIRIRDVTLLAITSIQIDATIEAIKKSCENIEFGEVKLISHERPQTLPKGIIFEDCPKIENIMDYNHYVFKDLGRHVDTSHCLMIQYHAYVLNYSVWNDLWLKYDYIGAPWRILPNTYIANNGEIVRVGNGGFSLRSKKILEAPKALGIKLKQEQGWFNEDGNLCCYDRSLLLDYGIKYAPLEVAVKFSYENEVEENKGIKPFGFHRNLPNWNYLISE